VTHTTYILVGFFPHHHCIHALPADDDLVPPLANVSSRKP
jgi:hypothetical protein